MYRLKDFDAFCQVAQKAIEGKQLLPHEEMYFNGFMNKAQVTQKSLQGLFQRQNIDAHSFVTKNTVRRIQKLYLNNQDVFEYYQIDGGSEADVLDLISRTLYWIRRMKTYKANVLAQQK